MNLDELSTRLQPWHAALQALGKPVHYEEPTPSTSADTSDVYVVWIGNFFISAGKIGKGVQLERACEAVALLTLLARIDVAAWKRKLVEIYPDDEQFREWIEFKVRPVTCHQRFAVGIEVSEVRHGEVRGLRHLQSANDRLIKDHTANKKSSTDFQALRVQMEAMVQLPEELLAAKSYLTVAVRAELDFFEMDHARRATPMLKQTLKHIETMQQSTVKAQSPSTHVPQLTIVEVRLSTTATVGADEQALRCLQKIAECGVRVGHLPPLDFPQDKRSWSHVIGAVRSLTALDGTSGATTNPGVRSVALASRCNPYLVPALLTAVQESHVVHSVEIDVGDSDEDVDARPWPGNLTGPEEYSGMWEKIAYSLFSHHASHKITRLEMSLDKLWPMEVDAVRRLLAATNPLARLEGRPDDDAATGDAQRRITASRFCLDDPDRRCLYHEIQQDGSLVERDAKGKDVFYETLQPIHVRVVSAPGEYKDHKWWCVVLPGHGTAWVHPDDLITSPTASATSTTTTTPRTLPSFPRIDVRALSEDSMEASVELLELIGHGTTHIDLHQLRDDSSADDWCRRVLAACPKLEILQVRHAQIDDLRLFVESAASGAARLREIVALIVPAGGGSDGLDATHVRVFLEVLGDPRHPLTENLQHLHIQLAVDHKRVAQQIMEPLTKMLRSNRRLETVHVGFTMPGPLRATMEPQFNAALAPHVEAQVVIHLAPLGLREKLAWLSVVQHHQQHKTTSALGQLDSSVLSLVFQFAAHARKREFNVEYTEPGALENLIAQLQAAREAR